MIVRLRVALAAFVSVSAFAAVLTAACSSSSSSAGIGAPDAADEAVQLGGSEGGVPADAPNDTRNDAPSTTCEGACKTTAIIADFGGRKRTLDRAQLGTQKGDGGVPQLHTESHLGGLPACPTMGSPSPDYTLIVSAVPRGATGSKLSDRDGITSAFFDFKGDLGIPPLTKAITVNVTVVGEDSATPPAWVALDVNAGFREGTVKGHLYATYCQSLSQ